MRSFHALALLRCVAVRGDRNHCNHHEVVADVDGTRAVRKTFKVLHGRGPVMASKSGACRRNKYSGLLPAQAYAIEVSVLTRLNERPRNASGACRGRYFPRLLRRDDAGLSFLQSHEGERIVTAWWHGRNPRPRVNRRFCALPRGEIACFATCATAALKAARVAHLDSFDVPTAAKNTVLRDGKLTLIDFDLSQLYGFPRTKELAEVRRAHRLAPPYAELLLAAQARLCNATDHRWNGSAPRPPPALGAAATPGDTCPAATPDGGATRATAAATYFAAAAAVLLLLGRLARRRARGRPAARRVGAAEWLFV